MNDYLEYDTGNLLTPVMGRENSQKLLSLLLPEIRKTIRPKYNKTELQAVICKIITDKIQQQ